MGVSRSNTKILSCVLLLRLRDICTPVLAIVDTAGCLPVGLLRKLRHGLDGITDGQEMNKSNRFLANDLHRVYRTELAKLLPKCCFVDVLRDIPQIYIPGRPRLLNG